MENPIEHIIARYFIKGLKRLAKKNKVDINSVNLIFVSDRDCKLHIVAYSNGNMLSINNKKDMTFRDLLGAMDSVILSQVGIKEKIEGLFVELCDKYNIDNNSLSLLITDRLLKNDIVLLMKNNKQFEKLQFSEIINQIT